MKTIKLILATALVALCVCSCGKAESTPETVAERCFNAMADGDFKEAVSLMVLPEDLPVDALVKDMEQDQDNNKFKGITFKAGEAKIDEEAGTATVKMSVTKDGETDDIEISLKKVDGKWKVDMF